MTYDFIVGDQGVALLLTLTDDDGPLTFPAGATATVDFLKPDGTLVTIPADVGDAGLVTSTLGPGVLDQAGTWAYMAMVAGPGFLLHSARGRLRIGTTLRGVIDGVG